MMFFNQVYHRFIRQLPWRAIGSVLLAFMITRGMVFVVTYFSMIELPVRERSDYFTIAPHNLVESGLVRWDSRYFLQISTTGYSTAVLAGLAVAAPSHVVDLFVRRPWHRPVAVPGSRVPSP